MKLLQHDDNWEFVMPTNEFHCLTMLLKAFPIIALSPARISTSSANAEMADREKLLNECLAEHRNELKRMARDLIRPERWHASKNGWSLRLSGEEREALLSILNDIRVECWRSLEEPEELEMNTSEFSAEQLKHYHFMHLAGYFQHHLLSATEET